MNILIILQIIMGLYSNPIVQSNPEILALVNNLADNAMQIAIKGDKIDQPMSIQPINTQQVNSQPINNQSFGTQITPEIVNNQPTSTPIVETPKVENKYHIKILNSYTKDYLESFYSKDKTAGFDIFFRVLNTDNSILRPKLNNGEDDKNRIEVLDKVYSNSEDKVWLKVGSMYDTYSLGDDKEFNYHINLTAKGLLDMYNSGTIPFLYVEIKGEKLQERIMIYD